MALYSRPYDEAVAESQGIREACNEDGSPAYFLGAVVRAGRFFGGSESTLTCKLCSRWCPCKGLALGGVGTWGPVIDGEETIPA